jgi:Cu2+-exporting ATPase
MCCPGCAAVARLIAGSGLESFYRQRTAFNLRPEDAGTAGQEYGVFDDAELADTFSSVDAAGHRQARILVDGISCAACTWLIERAIGALPGVQSAVVNLQLSRLDVNVATEETSLSTIFSRLDALGYRPRPFHSGARQEQLAREQKTALRRLAVAGIGMMQVGMFGIALHAGDIQGIEPRYQALLRWVSLPIAAFVVAYSARPFFENAWRHIRHGALVMDVPVALAIGLAFTASAWATVTGSGEVYFDSVVMFTFFLLLGRFLESRVRRRHLSSAFDAEDGLPAAVQVHRGGDWATAPRIQLQSGDTVLVRSGDTVPVDARVTAGRSAVREESFNGEHLPRPVQPGDQIYAGTLNAEAPLEARVLCSYRDSRLAALQRSVEEAQGAKPRLATLADRIASRFVAGILLLAALTALYWYQADPQRAFWITLSVLVISCPCALALATPAALTGATAALRGRGVIVHGENALEGLSRATHLLFDKTGTLTRTELELERVELLGSDQREDALALASGLQRYSNHAVAAAFTSTAAADGLSEVEQIPGAGVQGLRGGGAVRMGSEAFCRELCPQLPPPPDESLYWVALCREDGPVAWFGLGDQTRVEAGAVIRQAKEAGLALEVVTGDASPRAAEVARELGIETLHSGLSPQQKMSHVQELQSCGAVVAMVGDGLNDAPVLGLADASFSVAGAADLARTQADFVICDDNLERVMTTLRVARRCRGIIRQNFAWALGYNACAIPLAAAGLVAPWAAAIGMSLSSLLVVLNSLRLNG